MTERFSTSVTPEGTQTMTLGLKKSFLPMTFLMKKEPSTGIPALAYGVGHGGIEMIVIFGITMISNLVLSLMINSGQAGFLVSQTPKSAVSVFHKKA